MSPSFCLLEIDMENRLNLTLDGRLEAAAEFVRDGSYLIDVGTDHAYLPVKLLMDGRIGSAAATDINRGPLERAVANAEKFGVAEKIRFVLSDGLDWVGSGSELGDLSRIDVAVCGMGGELIVDILSRAEIVRQVGVRVILQPMTFADKVRAYLTESGFGVIDEKLCKSAGRVYAVICAEFGNIGCTGRCDYCTARGYSAAELALGRCNIARGGELFDEYAGKVMDKLKVKIAGMTEGGLDCSGAKELLAEIEGIVR